MITIIIIIRHSNKLKITELYTSYKRNNNEQQISVGNEGTGINQLPILGIQTCICERAQRARNLGYFHNLKRQFIFNICC